MTDYNDDVDDDVDDDDDDERKDRVKVMLDKGVNWRPIVHSSSVLSIVVVIAHTI